jgi:hypothetical protein
MNLLHLIAALLGGPRFPAVFLSLDVIPIPTHAYFKSNLTEFSVSLNLNGEV